MLTNRIVTDPLTYRQDGVTLAKLVDRYVSRKREGKDKVISLLEKTPPLGRWLIHYCSIIRTLIYQHPCKHNVAEGAYLDTRYVPAYHVRSRDSPVSWGPYCARCRFASERLSAALYMPRTCNRRFRRPVSATKPIKRVL